MTHRIKAAKNTAQENAIMPSVSQKQQEVAGMAHAIQRGEMAPKPGTPSAQMAASMKPSDVKDFASTPRNNLPVRRNPRPKMVGKPVKKVAF